MNSRHEFGEYRRARIHTPQGSNDDLLWALALAVNSALEHKSSPPNAVFAG